VKLHQAHLRTVYEAVKKNRDIHMDKAKINYDRSATNPQYKIGQLVMIQESKVNKKKSKKLSYKWDGPFRITDIINKINFKLKRVETKSGNTSKRSSTIIRHYNKLKPFRGEIPMSQTETLQQLITAPELQDVFTDESDPTQITQNTPTDNIDNKIKDAHIFRHKAVRNSFNFFIKKPNARGKQWVTKKELSGDLLVKYINSLPNKQLKGCTRPITNKPIIKPTDIDTNKSLIIEEKPISSQSTGIITSTTPIENNSFKCNQTNISNIKNHKAVKNSFHFLVEWIDKNKQSEWVKKADIEPVIIESYIDTLPGKSLRNLNKTQTTQATRFSERLKLK
jgi:hypothetical protein